MFLTTLSNVGVMLLYLIPGFLSGKSKKIGVDTLPAISFILVYIGCPCLVVSTFLKLDFSWEIFGKFWLVSGLSVACMAIFFLLVILLLKKKMHYGDQSGEGLDYRVLSIVSVMGNVGFFGLPLVCAIFPDAPEVGCYSVAFSFTLNIMAFSVGRYALTGKKKHMSAKGAFLNPNSIGVYVGCVLYVLFGMTSFTLPTVLIDAVTLVGRMTTPLCMLSLGIRLSQISVRKLFSCKTVYFGCFLKLVAFPLVSYFLVSLLPVDEVIKVSVLLLCGAPCGTVVYSISELYHSGQEVTADCLLLTTLFSIVTLPLLTLIV